MAHLLLYEYLKWKETKTNPGIKYDDNFVKTIEQHLNSGKIENEAEEFKYSKLIVKKYREEDKMDTLRNEL